MRTKALSITKALGEFLERHLILPTRELERLRDAVWMNGDPVNDYYGRCYICNELLQEFPGGDAFGHNVGCVWVAEDERRKALNRSNAAFEDGTISGAQPLDDIGRAQHNLVNALRNAAAKRAAERGLL